MGCPLRRHAPSAQPSRARPPSPGRTQSAARPMPYDLAFVHDLLSSYAAALSEPLVPREVPAAQAAAWLYAEAELALVAHDTQADPCFVYANLAAQRCFERPWAELVGMPSRFSAEAPERAARAAMLERVQRDGYVRDYRGIRIAASGRRFWIEGGIIWNIRRADGALGGQAACFRPPDAARR
jgi:hypothetical protein